MRLLFTHSCDLSLQSVVDTRLSACYTSADTMEKKERVKSREAKEKILRTTTRLLLKKGSFMAVSTTDICKAAKIARPSLYNYFGSKRNLLYSLHLDDMERVSHLHELYLNDPLTSASPSMVRTFTGDVIGRYPELNFLSMIPWPLKTGISRTSGRKPTTTFFCAQLFPSCRIRGRRART